MEYYLVIKENELLIHAKTWMNVKGIMLTKKSQFQKAISCVIILIRLL